ncbi:MAG: ATP-binding protein [Candidatus Cloacimonas sp.]|jgi:predicted AAA+ superfamily ATPase|nr:ATP-binding protein [Candidatus Cloacimonas sp.]
MINRSIKTDIEANFGKGKAIIIMGPRQSGKTTLLNELSANSNSKLYLNCDIASDRQELEKQSLIALKSLVGKAKLIMIDEAQRVQDIGLSLKIMVDNIPGIQIIATGSSSFELANRINEPLTGRKYEYHLHPFSCEELVNHYGTYPEKRYLSNRLVFGSYPDVINNAGEEQSILNILVGSYLYKDVFIFQDLRKPEILDKLLRALALQIGSEVSYTELAQLTQTDHSTIQRYIHLLEHAFIIFRLSNYSSNLRNEIKRARKFYFWDNGVRNCLINDYRNLENRDDVGKLWENYIVSERMKLLSNNRLHRTPYFWRSILKSEMDYLELFENKIEAYEIKWNSKRKIKTASFLQLYPHATAGRIDSSNYQEFLVL